MLYKLTVEIIISYRLGIMCRPINKTCIKKIPLYLTFKFRFSEVFNNVASNLTVKENKWRREKSWLQFN